MTALPPSLNPLKNAAANQDLPVMIGFCSCLGLLLCIAAITLAASFRMLLRRPQQSAPPPTPAIPRISTLEPTMTEVVSIHDPDLPEAHWPLVTSDSFDTDNFTWPVYSDQDGSRNIQNGEYVWNVRSAPGSPGVGWEHWPATSREVSDFYVSVDAKATDQINNSTYGLAFRYTKEGFYVFSLNDKGLVTVEAISFYQPINRLIKPTESALVRHGATNRLSVIATGSRLVFFINDQFFAELDDDTFDHGFVGIQVDLESGEALAQVAFDNFELHEPDSVPIPTRTLTISNTATAALTPTPVPDCNPNSTAHGTIDNTLPGYIDLLDVTTTLVKTRLTVVFTLREIPEEITIDRNSLEKGEDDIGWGVAIDTDHNTATGEPATDVSSGYGYEAILKAFNFKSGSERTGTIQNLFRNKTEVWKPEGAGWTTIGEPGTIVVDPHTKTITLSADISGITPESYLHYFTFYNDTTLSVDELCRR